MPALIGYMLAIVITLGGYFAALNWLIRPPDPWQSSARIPASTAQHVAAKKATTGREACRSRQLRVDGPGRAGHEIGEC